MTARTTPRPLRAGAVALGVALALSACASGNSNTTATTTAPTTPSSSAEPTAGTSIPSTPTTGTETGPGTGPTETRPTPPTRDDANVDARDFQSGPAFYFQSPSGNIMCGVYPDDPQRGAGCQAVDAPISPDGPPCANSANSAVGIKLAGGSAQHICLNQGVYVGPPVDGSDRGGGKVLAYGDTIIVQTVACQSTEAGITCWEAGSGFTLSRDVNEVF